jgi:hypothetical protein
LYKQTLDMCQSLPRFVDVLRAADRKGSSDWEIVRWHDVDPHDVAPDHVRVLTDSERQGEPDRFSSRSKALEASARITERFRGLRSERDHWGVWVWEEGGHRMFQTALPVNRAGPRRSDRTSALGRTERTGTGNMVRLSESSYALLQMTANQEQLTLQAVLDEAIRDHNRHKFFERASADYAALRRDAVAWAEELKEREEWDTTLMDGIDRGEVWDATGRSATRQGEERKSA